LALKIKDLYTQILLEMFAAIQTPVVQEITNDLTIKKLNIYGVFFTADLMEKNCITKRQWSVS
jgi:hypothetical protein